VDRNLLDGQDDRARRKVLLNPGAGLGEFLVAEDTDL
jgi:hypothetical protein